MVTIGTWNLENLFRPGQGDGPGSEEVYQTKLDALAETISVVEPDEPDFISSASPVGSTWLKPDTVTQRCTRLCTRLG